MTWGKFGQNLDRIWTAKDEKNQTIHPSRLRIFLPPHSRGEVVSHIYCAIGALQWFGE